MRKTLKISFLFVLSTCVSAVLRAQCSICAKTASQLGEDAGQGLNAGIIYLAAAPMLVVGYIGYRWWKNNS